MCQPQMRGLAVIGQHAHTVFHQTIKVVEEVRIHSDASRNGEVSKFRKIGKVAVINASDSDSPGNGVEKSTGSSFRSEGQSEIMSKRIRSAQRDNAERGSSSGQSLEHVMNRPIAAASDDGVEAVADG